MSSAPGHNSPFRLPRSLHATPTPYARSHRQCLQEHPDQMRSCRGFSRFPCGFDLFHASMRFLRGFRVYAMKTVKVHELVECQKTRKPCLRNAMKPRTPSTIFENTTSLHLGLYFSLFRGRRGQSKRDAVIGPPTTLLGQALLRPSQ